MATAKTFEAAGVSTLNGVTKVRFANDYVGRFKILAKNGHQDINLIELGGQFTKAQICEILLAHPKFQDESAQSAITEFVVRNISSTEKETEVEATPEVQVELEDAPF